MTTNTPRTDTGVPETVTKPCPFCGCTDEIYVGAETYCDNCGAEGPSYYRLGKPVASWNDRRVQPSPSTGGEPLMVNGTPLSDYLESAAPETLEMDDWTRGYEECRRRLFPIVGAQLRALRVTGGEPGLREAERICKSMVTFFNEHSRPELGAAVGQVLGQIQHRLKSAGGEPATDSAGREFRFVPIEPTDEMLRAQLAVEWPATYRDYLRHPANGEKSKADTEREIIKAKKRWKAMLDAASEPAPVARELDVEAERLKPPTLPRYLLDMIGEYGMARTDSIGQIEVQHRWEVLIGGIKRYAADFASTRQSTAESAPASAAPDEQKKLAHGHRDDFYLMANGRRIAQHPIRMIRTMPNWALASELFATGSNSARQICQDAGIDPDSCTIGRAPSNSSPVDTQEPT